MFYAIFEVKSVFVTVLHLEYPQIDGLKFATRTYIKREFDSKMSKTKFTKLAKWARKKKKIYDVVVWYLTIPGCDVAG